MSVFRPLLYTSLTVLMASCSFNSSINVRKAVDINPDDIRDIKNVVVLNRTAVPKGSKVTNVLEGVITGEVPTADRNAAEKCVNGLRECLQKSLNYTSAQLISVRMDGGSTTNVPPLLPWSMVDSLCNMYNSDLLVSLDFFDSNSGISMSVTSGVPAPAANTNNTVIKTTWRVYNRVSRKIVDDFVMKTFSNGARYKSPYFMGNTIDKYNVVSSTGYWAGIDYGFRISEQYLLENRTVYGSGSKSMKAAAKMARHGEWEGAMRIWDDEISSTSYKVKARALHNQAVYLERMGNLEGAYDKANESFQVKHYPATGFMMERIRQQLNDRTRMLSSK